MPKSPKPSRRPAARSRASAAPQPFTPAQIRARHDGWSREKQTGFIEALAASGCIEEACATIGMSRQSAYRLRVRPDAQGFRVAWDKALDYAIRRLSDACLSRALHGEVRPIFYKGEQIGERRVHDNKLAMFLLRYRDPLRYAATLDQMVYTGHPERVAIDLNTAINRVADEAEGICGALDEVVDPNPYEKEPIADVIERERVEAIIDSDAPVYGSHERQSRIKEARHARRARDAGYASTYAYDRDAPARYEAEQAREQAAIDAVNAALYGTPKRDSDADVPSPLSPSAPAEPPAKAPDRPAPVRAWPAVRSIK